MGQADPGRVSRVFGEIQPKLSTRFECDAAVRKLPYAQLWTLQVGNYGDGAANLLLEGADQLEPFRVFLVSPMAEIESEAVRPGLVQFLKHLGRAAVRTEGCQYLGLSESAHVSLAWF